MKPHAIAARLKFDRLALVFAMRMFPRIALATLAIGIFPCRRSLGRLTGFWRNLRRGRSLIFRYKATMRMMFVGLLQPTEVNSSATTFVLGPLKVSATEWENRLYYEYDRDLRWLRRRLFSLVLEETARHAWRAAAHEGREQRRAA